MMFYLRKPTIADETTFLAYVKEWIDLNEQMVPHSSMVVQPTYAEYLQHVATMEDINLLPPSRVPATLWMFCSDEEGIIGMVSIRHFLNDTLRLIGGHIGYGIRPSKRGNGYAKLMLELALKKAKEYGIDEVMITCDESNERSRRTILSCGGVYHQTVHVDHQVIEQYWIQNR